MKKLKLLSLFDGIGCFPLSYGNLTGDGQEIEYYSSEIEPYLIEILNKNFKNIHQLGDIKKVCWDSFSKNNDIDLITMGSPCTGFSISGKRDGFNNSESSLFKDAISIIDTIKPKYIVWENVFGSLTNNKGRDFAAVLKYFSDSGYNTIWTTLDMKYFGYPQKRRRVYLIAVRSDLNVAGYLSKIDFFNFEQRQENSVLKEFKLKVDKFYKNNESVNGGTKVYYYNRQRSDKFKAEGIAGALLKRDYKSFKDLIVYDDIIRRETPKERLRFQGMPDDWFDGLNIKDNSLYKADGMSLPVVDYVMNALSNIVAKQDYSESNLLIDVGGYRNPINYMNYSCMDSIDNMDELTGYDKHKKRKTSISYSGATETYDNGKIGVFQTDLCAEMADESFVKNIEIKSIADVVDLNVDKKYELTQKSLEGILRREFESNNKLDPVFRERILSKINEIKNHKTVIDNSIIN